MTEKGERIARRIARAGLCSRREAERWIGTGRVEVNGFVIPSPALVVRETDAILVDGKPLPTPAEVRLLRFHKPRGMVTTHSDPEGRPTVFDHLPSHLPLTHAVGRLDIDSEGLLLATTDGALKRRLELPATGLARIYRARCYGKVDPERLKRLEGGVTIDGIHYGPVLATVERTNGSNAWIGVTLYEGKNREVRRVLTHVGLRVNRLIRTHYGPFCLGMLHCGEWSEIPPRKRQSLLAEIP